MKNLLENLFLLLLISFLFTIYPIEAQWVRTNGPGGGRIYSFTANGDYIFAGAEGGIFISTDNGANWKMSGTGLPENTTFLALTSNGNSIFAGTYYKGIYVSTNNGASWAEANNGLPDLTSGGVSALASKGDTVFAGVYDSNKAGVYFTKDNGASWTSVSNGLPEYSSVNKLAAGKNRLFAATYKGLYLSNNNGLNWELLDSGIAATSITSLAVNGDTVYAGTDNGIIYGSFNGGQSWKELPTGFGAISISALAAKDNYVYAGSFFGGNYRSTDNGETWSPSGAGLTDNHIYALYIKDNLVFAGSYSGGVFVSSDKGSSWNSASKGLNYSTAAAMIIKDGVLLAGTPGGVFLSGDNGESWNDSHNGLEGSSIISFTQSGNDILAVSESRIYLSSDNGKDWTSITDKLPETKFNAAAAIGSYIFAGTDSGVFISTDKGANWKPANNGIKTYIDGILKVTRLTSFGNIIFAGAKMDPGGGGIFLSTDYGANWTASINEYGAPFNVNAISTAGNKIFIAYTFGFMHRQYAFVSADTGKSWKSVLRGFEPYAEISNYFVIGNKIYAETSGMFLYSESDTSWVSAAGVFPEKIISTVYNDKYVFAGTDGLGIFRRPVSEIITFPPETPKLLLVSNNSIDQPLSLTLSWNGSTGAETYNLQIAKDSLFKDLILSDSSLAGTSKEIKDLKEGQKYYWKVCSKNQAGKSPYSEVWNFTTILYAPDGLGASVKENKKINLTWKDNSENEAGYIIERKMDADFIPIDTVNANTLSYTDSTAKPATYHYRIYAYTPFAVSAYSNTASITLTGVDELAFVPREFRLFQNYPNPFNPVSTIRYWLPERSFVELKIFDMLGREVSVLINEERDAGEYKIQFNASGIPSGVYIYTIRAGSFRDSKKFILLK
ncbi:MAG TPA: T9SS type A sorting domain-containing protein [Ignavibacteriales bacterium]|nr:T9SS type A sorting domain-containing protein [Ignavibacteriales bacterium]